MRVALLVALLSVALADRVHAQATVRLAPDTGIAGQVTAATGFERALLPLSISGALAMKAFGRPLTFGAEFVIPMSHPDFGDGKGRLTAALDINPRQGWLVRITPGLSFEGTQNTAFNAFALIPEVGAIVGWSSRRWVVGAEMVGSFTLFTSLWTTDYARKVASVPITTATLWAPAWGLEIGARAGVLIGPVELSLRAGWDHKGIYNFAIPPAYAMLGVGVRFGQRKHF